MSDIVERLRDAFAEDPNIGELGEAADEIDRLRNELHEAQRLTDQLRENAGEAQNDLRDEVTKNDRLRELIKKDINHVAAEEGTTFMPGEYDGFLAEEIAALKALEAEARAAWAKEAGQ